VVWRGVVKNLTSLLAEAPPVALLITQDSLKQVLHAALEQLLACFLGQRFKVRKLVAQIDARRGKIPLGLDLGPQATVLEPGLFHFLQEDGAEPAGNIVHPPTDLHPQFPTQLLLGNQLDIPQMHGLFGL
jgi:hypothetical protein